MTTQQQALASGQEATLRDYVIILVQQWKVLLAVLAVIVGGTATYTYASPNVYEARTRVLIVPRSSAGIVDTPQLQNTLSVETLSALATARDLLQQIIVTIDLRDAETQEPWNVDRLATMMRPKVETAGRPGQQSSLPLLTMSVRGQEPRLLKEIADTWAEAFVQKNAALFSSEAARSYDFAEKQMKDTEAALRVKENERLTFQQENPVPLLQAELNVTSSAYAKAVGKLQDRQEALVDTKARLQILEPSFKDLLRRRAEKRTYEQANLLAPLQVDLKKQADDYAGLQVDIGEKRQSMTVLEARIAQLESELSKEPNRIRVTHTLPNSALFGVVGEDLTNEQVKALGDVVIVEDLPNPRHDELRHMISNGYIEKAALLRDIAALEPRLAASRDQLGKLIIQIDDIKARLARFDEEALAAGLNDGLVASLGTAQAGVATLEREVLDLRDRVVETEATSRRLSNSIGQAQLTLDRMDVELGVLQENSKRLAQNFQSARLAKDEQTGSIRIVEEAVEPTDRVAPNRKQTFAVGGAIGLFLSVAAAYLWYFVQSPRLPGLPQEALETGAGRPR